MVFNIAAQSEYSKTIVINGLDVSYNCSSDGNTFNSQFSVRNGGNPIYESAYTLDTSVTHYKLVQSSNVLQVAQASSYRSDLSSLNKGNELIETLLNDIFNEEQINRDLVQSIFFHRAMIKHNLRFVATGDDSFLPHPGYFINKTYFFDQRDYFIKKAVILQVIDSHSEFQNDSSAQLLVSYLNNYEEEELSFEKFYSFFVSQAAFLETIQNILNERDPNQEGENERRACAWWCPIGCGSDWGCCGNYSGCCFFKSLICLVHDGGCSYTQCQPRWLCFSGCVID